MKTIFFDGSFSVPVRDAGRMAHGSLSVGGIEVPGTVRVYAGAGTGGEALVRIAAGRPLDVKWMDRFEFRSGDGKSVGHGFVLLPDSPDPKKMKSAKRRALLERLSKGEMEMILALAEEKGIHGLRGSQIADFCRLEPDRVEILARKLEEADAIRILSFSPLFLVSRRALDFLREKVTDFMARYHERHSDERGLGTEKIAERFGPPDKILSLVLRTLEKSGKLKSEGGLVRLADFRILLRPEDEDVLERLEAILYNGEFAAASLEDVRRKLRLGEKRLQALLSVLLERKKIVKGKDGFLLHSRWLDDLVKTVRASGKRDLTVADFKSMTGLSRKYAIPLLELLDEMGVTRRRGSARDIL
jgi:selenocysteine-specific elongation factor